MTGQLLTARQTAELLGVSTETILRWVRNGKLPAIYLPSGAVRIRETDLERKLQEWAARPARKLSTVPEATPPGASLSLSTVSKE